MKYLLLLFILFGCSVSTYKHQNTESNDSMDWHQWNKGKKFSYYYVDKNFSDDSVISLVLVVGNKDIAIDKIALKGDFSSITWTWSSGDNVDIDLDSGVIIREIPLNITVNSSSGATLLINPSFTGTWLDEVQDVRIYGMEGALNRVVAYDEIITRKIAFKANSNHRLLITNQYIGATYLEARIYFEIL